MNMPRVLFIPDMFMDYRMWSDVPDRIRERAVAIHYDQHEQVPWTTNNGRFLDAARRLAAGGSFDVVAAAGQAARFGFAVAEAGLGKGLVLFYPALDSFPDDLHVDFSDLDEMLEPYEQMASVIRDPQADAGRLREVLLQTVRDTAGPDLPPDQLELALAMHSDHAQEMFEDLRSTAEAVADGRVQSDPPWMERPW